MAKRNNKVKHREERDDEYFDSFREIPIKSTISFDISDKFKNHAQRLAYSVYEQHDITFLLGPAGTGKSFLACMFALNDLIRESKNRIVLTRPIVEAGEKLGFLPGPQPLDAKILIPSGWTTMGSIKVGDMVIGRNGKVTKVIEVIPKGKKLVYKLTTTENTSTECCEDHLWLTRTAEDKKRNRQGSIKTTKQIHQTLLNKRDKLNHFLPRNESVEFDKKSLPLDPYVLGVLLGDGYFGEQVSFTNCDEELIARVAESVDSLNCKLTRNVSPSIGGVKYEFLPLESRWSNPVKKIIDDLGLLGKRSFNKFIPDIYKYSSIEDRIQLLCGLMDTDGTVKERGEASFTTTSRQLALDLIEVVRSLGGRAVLPKGREGCKSSCRRIHRYKAYEFTINLPKDINPFYINRKSKSFNSCYMHQIGIQSITPIEEKEVQCILVEDPEHLYLTDDFIVTHNTFSDKTDPYMIPLYDCIRKLIPSNSNLAEYIQTNTEVAPIAYLRGRTLSDSICILDEAQNCDLGQLVLYLTRLGEDSKMIITGDPTQSDIGKNSALMDVVHRLGGVNGIGVVTFTEEHIVRHKLVSEIIKRLGRNF